MSDQERRQLYKLLVKFKKETGEAYTAQVIEEVLKSIGRHTLAASR